MNNFAPVETLFSTPWMVHSCAQLKQINNEREGHKAPILINLHLYPVASFIWSEPKDLARPASADANGSAALSMCESLLLCLSDVEIINLEDVLWILNDAATVHRNAAEEGENVISNLAVAELISAIARHGDSFRLRKDG